MSKFIKTTLLNKINIKHGFPFLGEYFTSSGEYIILTPGNFYEEGGFKLQIGKEKFYYHSFPEEYLHQKGDLIVAMTEQCDGLLGSAAIVPSDNRYLHNQRLGLITMNENEMDKIFMYYLFNTKYIRRQISLSSTGTKVKHTSPKRIYDVIALLPDVDIQQKIAKVLLTLDAKIELNNRINKELEAMAKTLCDYWFVQFDFPHANGKAYKSSGGKMVYNKELKREIPEGWEVKELGNIEKNIITGKTPPKENKDYFDGNIPFITIGDIRGNMHIVKTEETLSELGADYQKNKYINKGAICVSCIASPGLVGFATEPSQTNQQINTIECEKEENKYYLYFAIKDFFIASKAKTGNTFPNMNKGDFSDIKLVNPSSDNLDKFKNIVKPIFDKIFNNSQQTQNLTQLRDFLLPMLMNGQVSVK